MSSAEHARYLSARSWHEVDPTHDSSTIISLQHHFCAWACDYLGDPASQGTWELGFHCQQQSILLLLYLALSRLGEVITLTEKLTKL